MHINIVLNLKETKHDFKFCSYCKQIKETLQMKTIKLEAVKDTLCYRIRLYHMTITKVS